GRTGLAALIDTTVTTAHHLADLITKSPSCRDPPPPARPAAEPGPQPTAPRPWSTPCPPPTTPPNCGSG
ncbi:hypothetical protein E5Z02_25700, partial [Streptomyces rhizosphaericola]